jgi:hypothetical protein
VNKPTVTAAIKAASAEVTELRTYGFNSCYREWCFFRLDRSCNAWVESPKTWRAAAAQSRRMALVRAALDWACREFDLALPYVHLRSAEQHVWANYSVRDVLKAELPHLIPAQEA